MKTLLIFSAASGYYLDYMPLWHYCILSEYPEYNSSCIVIKNPINMYYSAVFRLLQHPKKDYKYIYVTDIDMMILRENPTLLDFHLNEMKNTGLCYSNSKRKSEPMGDRRMTGLHFCNQEWYYKTRNIREKYMHMLENGEIGNGRFDDELTLMKIIKSCKIDISPRFVPLIQRHHGIHMGTLRNYRNHTRQKLNQQLRMRILPQQARQWLKKYEDNKFVNIIKSVCDMNRILKWEYETLYSFCMRRSKEK